MFSQTLYVQWKWNRDFLAFFTAICFASPLLILWIALPHAGFTSARELVTIGNGIGVTIGTLAVFAGLAIAWQGYGVDDRAGHVYALSLPVPRWRLLALRAATASVTLILPAIGAWIGASLTLDRLTMPATLEGYAGSLALRALLASWLAHAAMFALRYSAGRRAKLVLGVLAGVAVVLSLLAVVAPQTRELIARIGDLIASNPGPLGVLFGRWTLIDV